MKTLFELLDEIWEYFPILEPEPELAWAYEN
jgi:hypothetical protein